MRKMSDKERALSDMEVREILRMKLDAKDYEGAAKVILYHVFCKMSPGEFAKRLTDAVKDWMLWGEEGAKN